MTKNNEVLIKNNALQEYFKLTDYCSEILGTIINNVFYPIIGLSTLNGTSFCFKKDESISLKEDKDSSFSFNKSDFTTERIREIFLYMKEHEPSSVSNAHLIFSSEELLNFESTNKEFFLLIYMDENKEHQSKVVSFDSENNKDKQSFYHKAINCKTFEFLQYSEELDFVTDEEGRSVSGNPVFQIPNDLYVEDLHVTGSFLIGKRVETEQNVETIGFTNEEELWSAIHQAKFRLKLIGTTK